MDKYEAALDALMKSKKYGEFCEDTLRRVFERAAGNHKTLKDAEKAARAELHQIAGAYMTADQLRAARKHLREYAGGNREALYAALKLHASTRERLARIDALYDEVFDVTGTPEFTLDLACGLNPLYLGARGLRVHGMDIHGGAVALIDEWARACGFRVTAEVKDVLCADTYPRAGLALMMKLLPVLEQQQSGAAARLIRLVPARHKLVTFPTRTLGGRGVGMEKHYSAWFEGNLPDGHAIVKRFLASGELCYILEEKNG